MYLSQFRVRVVRQFPALIAAISEHVRETMRTFLATVVLGLLFAVTYLQAGRVIGIKRWLLPATAAALAAVLAASFANFVAGGTATGYAVGLPLGLSAGCLLHHLLEFCHRCGATPPLVRSVLSLPHHEDGARRCERCVDAFRR